MNNKINIFAHRGYVINDSVENSIESLDFCYKYKFYGVEFDIWFLENKLVLCHDMPKNDEINKLPSFDQYFKYKNSLKYWLDFKNFDQISLENLDELLKLVKKSLEKNEISLQNVYFAPFLTNFVDNIKIYDKIYDIFGKNVQIMAIVDEKIVNLLEYKKILLKHNIKNISVNYKTIDEKFIEIMSDFELYVWTVNSHDEICKLSSFGIKNFCSDKITPNSLNEK